MLVEKRETSISDSFSFLPDRADESTDSPGSESTTASSVNSVPPPPRLVNTDSRLRPPRVTPRSASHKSMCATKSPSRCAPADPQRNTSAVRDSRAKPRAASGGLPLTPIKNRGRRSPERHSLSRPVRARTFSTAESLQSNSPPTTPSEKLCRAEAAGHPPRACVYTSMSQVETRQFEEIRRELASLRVIDSRLRWSMSSQRPASADPRRCPDRKEDTVTRKGGDVPESLRSRTVGHKSDKDENK